MTAQGETVSDPPSRGGTPTCDLLRLLIFVIIHPGFISKCLSWQLNIKPLDIYNLLLGGSINGMISYGCGPWRKATRASFCIYKLYKPEEFLFSSVPSPENGARNTTYFIGLVIPAEHRAPRLAPCTLASRHGGQGSFCTL